MQTKIKQRFIGFLILFAILAIFLPLLFHNSHPVMEVQSVVKIPPKPKVAIAKKWRQEEPVIGKSTLAQTSTPIAAPLAAASIRSPRTKVPKAQEKPVRLVQQKLTHLMEAPQAWSVQLGTFGDVNHANALIKKLRKKGFDAYTHPILDANGKRLLRVYVGPEIQKERALQLRDEVQTILHLKGVVRQYKVNM